MISPKVEERRQLWQFFWVPSVACYDGKDLYFFHAEKLK